MHLRSSHWKCSHLTLEKNLQPACLCLSIGQSRSLSASWTAPGDWPGHTAWVCPRLGCPAWSLSCSVSEGQTPEGCISQAISSVDIWLDLASGRQWEEHQILTTRPRKEASVGDRGVGGKRSKTIFTFFIWQQLLLLSLHRYLPASSCSTCPLILHNHLLQKIFAFLIPS